MSDRERPSEETPAGDPASSDSAPDTSPSPAPERAPPAPEAAAAPADAQPSASEPARSAWAPKRTGEAVTDSGYSYTVVDDSAPAKPAEKPPKGRQPREQLRVSPLLLAALIAVPVIAAAAITWFVVSMLDDDGGADRADADIASLIQAFSGQGDGSSIQRFEGELAPGFPEDVPAYPGGRLVSSIVQVTQNDALYWAVYDTDAGFDGVVKYFHDELSADPWQIDLGQDSRESSVRQFSRIDDADVQGVVLVSASKEGDVTTIFQSINVVAGAEDAPEREFEPSADRPLPEGFPDEIPAYPDATVIETAFRREPTGDGFAVSLITRDDALDVLNYYRDEMERLGWTVADADASQSELPEAQAITFEAGADDLQGNVTTSEFVEDENYTRIDVQVNSARSSGD